MDPGNACHCTARLGRPAYGANRARSVRRRLRETVEPTNMSAALPAAGDGGGVALAERERPPG